MSTVRSSTVRLCCIAVLAALLILMALTPLGYIPIGPLRLTLLMLPVAVGGAVLGPRAGLVLGTVFGLTSFFTCFGTDPFGAVLLGISPLRTAVMCIVPRMLAGLLPALLCRLIRRRSSGRAVGVAATALSCALTAALNTLFFPVRCGCCSAPPWRTTRRSPRCLAVRSPPLRRCSSVWPGSTRSSRSRST